MFREYDQDRERGLGRLVVFLGAVFLVALAVVVGTRLSQDAIGVLVGVIAGVAASIPTALLLIVVMRRREQESEPEYYDERRQSTPPVIVVAPGSVPQMLPQYPGTYPPQQLSAPQGRRQFRVMGLEDEESDTVEGETAGATWY